MEQARQKEVRDSFDVIVIGSGMGGSIITRQLVEAGLTVCLLERGDFIPQEKANWDITEVSLKGRYRASETWYDKGGQPFQPRVYYNVGGASKFYGGAAFRLRKSDFAEGRHADGVSPAWPFPYTELASWYDQAETLLNIHGSRKEDPSDPGEKDYPAPPIEHEPVVATLAHSLQKQGLHPFHTPLAIDFGPGGRCRKGSPCDGFPCMVRAKGDAENRVLRPLYLKKHPALTLLTSSRAVRILHDGQTVTGVEYENENGRQRVLANTVVVSAGAIQSALLLLDSNIANSSGLVGRNYLCHNNTVVMALRPFKKNDTKLQKTLSLNDFYHANADSPATGNIQLRGKVHPEMLAHSPNPLIRLFRTFIARRSLDFWVMSEDLPLPENRVYRDSEGKVHLERTSSNIVAHRGLIQELKRSMRKAGYFFFIVTERGIESIQHQTGTLRMGSDPATSVLNEYCCCHDVPNLYVVDGSFFPSAGAVNPALTIAAQALRTANKMVTDLTRARGGKINQRESTQ